MSPLPTGTVAFLFTDIQGSTQLWQKYPADMPAALAKHHALLTQSIETNDGYVFQIIGDAFCAAFHTMRDAVAGALAAQLALSSAEWGATGPIQVRMAIHAGAAEVRPGEATSGEYVSGITLSRAARLLSAGHGGQVLLSLPAAELVRDHLPAGTSLLDLGSHRLKDLIRPEQIFQILAGDLAVEFPPLKTLDSLPHNLPVQLTSFIGREKELEELAVMIGDSARRMLSLLGPGGAGKTRLALQVAAEFIERFPDGAWLVDFSALDDPQLLVQAVAGVWALREQPAYPLLDTLKDFLRHKRLLLILDNCEHVAEACAHLSQALLLAAPGLHLLVTSREPLGVPGEVLYRLASLAVPDPRQLPPVEALSTYDSVRLFIDRAQLVQPTFTLDNANAPAVAQICSRLDGIPLAIELAAARVRSFSPEQINARLEDRFRLLTGGSRTGMPRQQTLQAAIDWSHDLLSEPERLLFRRLSVFNGGWTFQACETVCSGDGLDVYDILDLLPRLVDRSLVAVNELPGGVRYRLLDTIRLYSRQKLLEAGEESKYLARHLDVFQQFAKAQMPGLEGSQQLEALEVFDNEIENYRSALEYALRHDPVQALRLVYFLWLAWFMRGYFIEGRRWAESAFQAAESISIPDEVRSKALSALAAFAYFQGEAEISLKLSQAGLELAHQGDDRRVELIHLHHIGLSQHTLGMFAEGQAVLDEGIQLARLSHDRMLLGWLLNDLSIVMVDLGETDRAEKLILEAVELAKLNGDRWGLSFLESGLSEIAVQRGQLDQAERLTRDSASALQQLKDKHGYAGSLLDLAKFAWWRGDFIQARSHVLESLEIERQLGRDRYVPNFLEDLANFMVHYGGIESGLILLASAEAHRTEHSHPSKSVGALKREVEEAHERARSELGEAAYQAALNLGRSLSLEQAIAQALAGPRNPNI